MIGNANIYFYGRRRQANVLGPYLIDIKPPGDCPGYYWGAIRWRIRSSDENVKPGGSSAQTAVLNVEVAGVSVFRNRHIQRSWFAPYQYYQRQLTPSNNYFWETNQSYNNPNPSGTFGGRQSYMNAFFEKAEPGPSSTPMAFTAGTTGNNSIRAMQANCEWVFFAIKVQPGQTLQLRCRLYAEVPNSTLGPPINDDPPAAGSDAEPDEVLGGEPWFEGWVVRVGAFLEEVQTIQSIGTVGGEE
jgi:hypothetical protein